MLREKLNELEVEVEYLNAKYWEDEGNYLPKFLAEEEIECHFEEDILIMNNGKAEIAYVKIYDKVWLVSFRFIQLWMPSSFGQCLAEAEQLKDSDSYFATPYDDEDSDDNGRKALVSIGFQTESSEGF